jgi:hypothetical protein
VVKAPPQRTGHCQPRHERQPRRPTAANETEYSGNPSGGCTDTDRGKSKLFHAAGRRHLPLATGGIYLSRQLRRFPSQ